MTKFHILLIAGGVLTSVALFSLPKKALNDNTPEGTSISQTQVEEQKISETEEKVVSELRKKLSHSENKNKKAIFADSIATIFYNNGILDSAVFYYDSVVAFLPTVTNYIKAADVYLESAFLAEAKDLAHEKAKKARVYYNFVEESDPVFWDTKVKLGATFLWSDNPMKGVSLIREVLAKHPDNRFALYYMGVLLAMRGDIDKAVNKLEQLVLVIDKSVDLTQEDKKMLEKTLVKLGAFYSELDENDKAALVSERLGQLKK